LDDLSTAALHQLAKLYGVHTAYYDIAGQQQAASDDALLATLRALRAPIARLEDVPAAIREHQQAQWRRPMEPVRSSGRRDHGYRDPPAFECG